MRSSRCDRFGIDLPIVGVAPSEHVAAAISRAGGLGVLGWVRVNDAAGLDAVLSWLDENTGGKPYDVDIVRPAKNPAEGTRPISPSSSATPTGPLSTKCCVISPLPPLPDDTTNAPVCSAGCTPSRGPLWTSRRSTHQLHRQRAGLAARRRDRPHARRRCARGGARGQRRARGPPRRARRGSRGGTRVSGRRPHRRDRVDGAGAADRRRRRRTGPGARGRRHRLRPAGRGRADAPHVGRVEGSFWLATEEYRRTMPGSARCRRRWSTRLRPRPSASTGKPARLLKRAGRTPGPLPTRPNRCRTSWSPTPTTASTPRTTRPWCRCRWANSSAG